MARCKLDKVEILPDGAREILNSPRLQRFMQTWGRKIAASCGKRGYAVDTLPGKNRAHTRVKTTTKKAFEENQKRNVLLKGLKANKKNKVGRPKKRKRKGKAKKGGKK